MKTFEEIAPALAPLAKRYRHNTRLEACAGEVVLWLHATPIVTVYPSGLIQLNTGGYHTVTTKRRMNEALQLLGADFTIHQRDYKWYTWNWRTHEDGDFMDHAMYRADGHAS